MPPENRRPRLAALALALMLAAVVAAPDVAAAQAATVVLRAKAGTFEFAARLRSFDGKSFVIEGPMGRLTLDAASYDCIGDGCPAASRQAAAPETTPAGATQSLGIHGSNTIGSALMPALVRGYAQSVGATIVEAEGANAREVAIRVAAGPGRPDIARIDLQRHGSSSAFPALLNGAAELGMADRPVSDEELRSLNVPGQPPLRQHVIGLDAIAVVVARDSPVTVLGIEQIARIFAGDIADWSGVGLPAGPIKVYAPDAGRGTLDLFTKLVMKPNARTLGPYVTRLGSYLEMAEAVARDPRAIAVVSQAHAGAVKMVALRQSCGLSVPASAFTIKTEEYPLARRLNVYSRGEPTSAFAQGLLQFAASAAGQAVVKQAQFVDQSVDTASFAAEEARFAAQPAWVEPAPWRALVSQLRGAQRLSLTFRFTPGSSEIEAKSRQDLARLADLVRAGRLPGRTMLLVGYADTIGTPQANSALALKRAAQVRTALLALAPTATQNNRTVLPLSLGAAAPVACNDTAEGQQVNRRVEVWVRD